MQQLGRLACVCAAALVAVVLAAPAQAATGTDCATDGRSAADRHPRPTVRVPHTYPVEDAGPDDQVFLSESLGSNLLHTLPEAGRQGRAAAWLGASGCSGGDHNVWVAGRDGTVMVDNHYLDAPPTGTSGTSPAPA